MLLSSAYLAPVHYYAKLYSSALARVPVIEEQADHYVKQTYRNRCIIAGDDGPVALTVPVTAPNHTPMHQVIVSDHGNWRHQHWQAIVSAYQSSPYFEYYADELSNVFHARPADGTPLSLVDFNTALRDWVLDCLDLHPTILVNRDRYLDTGSDPEDFRETIRPKIPYDFDPTFCPTPYWQVFQARHGFLPNLSILDLLFNMGPESRIILRKSVR